MDAKRVVIVGSSFAGLTAALELHKLIGVGHVAERHEIVVLDPRPEFTFIPSLIWLPFGLRQPRDVTFPLAPMYSKKGIRFINEAAARIDPQSRTVTTTSGQELSYDRLFIGTGPRLAFERVPGLGPEGGYTQSVCNLDHALAARAAWERFLRDPGPVVVGTAQGGSCFGASYEFLLNLAHRIRKAGLEHVAPVTFITAEPYLGHFGLSGVGDSQRQIERVLERRGIQAIVNASISQVREHEIELTSGRVLPFAYAMIVPPFAGVDVVAQTPGLANPMGFIAVDERYRHRDFAEIYAAGVAIAIAPPAPTPVPAGVPKTGQMSETMARVAARNIAADLIGSPSHSLALERLAAMCILDAGSGGVIFKADNVLSTAENGNGASRRALVSAGPHAHLAKLAFERVYLQSRKHGQLVL